MNRGRFIFFLYHSEPYFISCPPSAPAGAARRRSLIHEPFVPIFLPRPDHRPAHRADAVSAVHFPGLDRSAGAHPAAPVHRQFLHPGHGPGAGHPRHPGHRLPGVETTRAALAAAAGNAVYQPAGGQEHLFVAQELRRLFFAQRQDQLAAGRDPAHARQSAGAGGPGHPPHAGRPAGRVHAGRPRGRLPAHGLHDRRLHRVRAHRVGASDPDVGGGSHALVPDRLDGARRERRGQRHGGHAAGTARAPRPAGGADRRAASCGFRADWQ